MFAMVTILGSMKALGKVDFPDFSWDIPKQVFPLPLLYLANMISGLMSTQVSLVFYCLVLSSKYNQSESIPSNVHSAATILNFNHDDLRTEF